MQVWHIMGSGAEMSGLSYFVIQIQFRFLKTKSKSNYSPKYFSNEVPNIWKMQLFYNKMPHFFSINSAQIWPGS